MSLYWVPRPYVSMFPQLLPQSAHLKTLKPKAALRLTKKPRGELRTALGIPTSGGVE
jgi:hypothetical protein